MKTFPLFLAPLAGVSDASFRYLCRRFGADRVFTEMVSAKGLLYGDEKTHAITETVEGESNVTVQIFGSDPAIMAKVVQEYFNPRTDLSGIDINMGCPAPKIVKNGDGSALLKNPKLAGAIVRSVVKVSNKPVSVKYRLGIEGQMPYLDLAKRFEDAGAAYITLHPRTREEQYMGKSDWSKIAEVVRAVSIPVVGNGDVERPEDAVRMVEETGCSAVMIGRGAMGAPWLFHQIKEYQRDGHYNQASMDLRLMLIDEQYQMVEKLKGPRRANREMRKHIAWYLRGIRGTGKLKAAINTETDRKKVMAMLQAFVEKTGERDGTFR